MSDDENGGLFAIEVSSDEEASTTAAAAAKVPRDFQSEADFQRVKASYRPKVETGDVCTLLLSIVIFTVFLPLPL